MRNTKILSAAAAIAALAWFAAPVFTSAESKATPSEATPSEATPSEEAPSEGAAILQKARDAAMKVKAVRFTGAVEPLGMAKAFVASMNGTALISGWNEEMQMPAQFSVDIEATPPGAEASRKISAGGNGESFFLVDHSDKKAYEDIDPGVLGSNAQTLQAFSLVQLVHPQPYQRDLASQSEVLGKKEIAGEECYEIRVNYPPESPQAGSTWFISTRDFLPRGRTIHFVVPQQGEANIMTTLTKLEVDPGFEPSLFRLKLPEGYEQIDDFAP